MTGKKEGTRKYREIVTPVIRQPETRSQRNQEPLSDTQKKSAMELKKKSKVGFTQCHSHHPQDSLDDHF